MNRDLDQIKILSIFHFVVAGIAALFACFPIFPLMIGISMLTGSLLPKASSPNMSFLFSLFGLMFTIIPAAMILFGWPFAISLAVSGYFLSKKQHYRFCAIMAGISCIFIPFGTILGVFTIGILMRQSKAMASYNLEDQNFDEKEYLLANPDVADAVKKGKIKSGRWHYDTFGKNENRKMRLSPSPALVNVRSVLRYYIAGNGIEIGALHKPLDISGLPVTNIKYVDRLTIDELRKQYPELSDLKLVQVDIIDNGEILGKIESETLDFIIANHFIEHARDPMGTIGNWLSKLRPGGIIFMAVPDKHYTFDVNRELTPLQHLVADYCSNPKERLVHDRQHFVEWTTLVNKSSADEIEPYVNHLMEIDYSIHFHTFTLQSFLEMLNYLRQERKLPFVMKACADIIHESNEFLVVLMRA